MIGLALTAWRFFRFAMMLTLISSLLTLGRASYTTLASPPSLAKAPTFDTFGKVLSEQLAGYRDGVQIALAKIRLGNEPAENGRVVRVIDGDTLDVRIDDQVQRVRIIGVDTPETVKPGVRVQCFGTKASSFSKAELDHKVVKLTYDHEPHDRYGRVLAYVELHSKDFGEALLRRGYARTMTIAPNTARADHYAAIQRKAKRAKRGLWGACS